MISKVKRVETQKKRQKQKRALLKPQVNHCARARHYRIETDERFLDAVYGEETELVCPSSILAHARSRSHATRAMFNPRATGARTRCCLSERASNHDNSLRSRDSSKGNRPQISDLHSGGFSCWHSERELWKCSAGAL